jgi:hypothetical protein
MGFNRRKMEDQRQQAAEKEAAERRATDAQVLEDAERLIAAWNERQAKRMPMLFSPTIGAAIAARYWFLWVRCPACQTINAIDLRTLDRHPDAAVTSLIPALSCRSCRPNAPFAELVQLSRTSVWCLVDREANLYEPAADRCHFGHFDIAALCATSTAKRRQVKSGRTKSRRHHW